jgi:hypothetical protein
MSDDREVSVSAVYLRETAKAYCVLIEGEERWIPKSVVTDITEGPIHGEHIDLFVKPWFAEKEDLA